MSGKSDPEFLLDVESKLKEFEKRIKRLEKKVIK